MTRQWTLREARGRRKHRLTQVQLAKLSRVDQTYISLLERGLRNPSDDIKERLAKALGIAPSSLRFTAPESTSSVDRGSDKAGHSGKSREVAAS